MNTNTQLATTTAFSPVAMPTNAMEAMQLAKDLAGARLVPSHFQKSPPDLFMVICFCQRFQLDFFMTVQEVSVIRNRLFCSGKLTAAMLHASGALAERLSYTFSGEGDDLTVTVSARLVNELEPRTVKVRLRDVRTENDNWKRNPEQQLTYAGARIWGRRHTPEILLGLMFEGETIDVTPAVVVEHSPLSPSMSQDQRSTLVDAQAEAKPKPEIATPAEPQKAKPYTLPACHDDEWRAWAAQLIGYVRAEKDADTIEAWLRENDDQLQNMREVEPKMFKAFENAVELHKATLADPAEEVVP